MNKSNWCEKSNLIKIDDHHLNVELITLAQRYEAKIFFETGTHLGNRVLFMALQGDFKEIHSVEISKSWIKLAQRSLSNNNIDMSQIHLWWGDSAKCMPEILNNIGERCIFWLDAHYSGGEADGKSDGEHECALIGELNAIRDHHIDNHVIVIDDIADSISGIKGWPNINEICKLIKQINSQYCITVKYGRLFAEISQMAFQPLSHDVAVYDVPTEPEVREPH
tara:strand:+ start:547 stop:1215 length:669 start_codon:yes stop_codon:yes gene_type:complete